MSYNGIGLSTVRGSGTNGYVQRNLSTIRRVKEKVGIKTEEELDDLDLRSQKRPNLELLDHNRKRKVEVKCMELQDLMEEQGYDEEEIQKKVDSYRQMLLENQDCLPGKEDSSGRPVITETHQIAEMKEKENESLREAFGIRKDYIKGSAFMNDKSSANQEEPKNYKLVRSPSKSPSPRREHQRRRRTPEKRRRKRSTSVQSSDQEERGKKKSSKKKHETVKKRSRSDSDREYSRHHQSKKAKRKKEKHSKKKHHEKKSKQSKSRKKSSRSRRDTDSDSSSDSD